ncbi:unnamed protein product [Tetraodon nigroviridis]|uniref:(spotted green pufferfish) hypothetical protein n=1 Tax=Tetraodon nigroviridis TaxID=99883 RepID=Q4TCN2_TETNG|nr:unnamed protein product [Tetraodon nigroviridis]
MVAVLRQARRPAVHAEVAAGDLTHHLLLGKERQALVLASSRGTKMFTTDTFSCFREQFWNFTTIKTSEGL